MKRHGMIGAALAMGCMTFFACSGSEDRREASGYRDGAKDADAKPVSDRDREFMTTATQSNLAEVDAGRLAEGKSTQSDVKKFGQHMVEDHTKANSELMDLARKKGVQLPRSADQAHLDAAASLSRLGGAEFDKKFATMMVGDHLKAVALFEDHAKNAKDAEVRAFAEKTLPVLRHHLQMARDLNKKVGGTPSAD